MQRCRFALNACTCVESHAIAAGLPTLLMLNGAYQSSQYIVPFLTAAVELQSSSVELAYTSTHQIRHAFQVSVCGCAPAASSLVPIVLIRYPKYASVPRLAWPQAVRTLPSVSGAAPNPF